MLLAKEACLWSVRAPAVGRPEGRGGWLGPEQGWQMYMQGGRDLRQPQGWLGLLSPLG